MKNDSDHKSKKKAAPRNRPSSADAGQQHSEEALRWDEEKLHSLFSNMSEGFAYHRIVLDEKGQPIDYVFLEVNEAFERLTGLSGKDIVGKKVTEVLPGIEKDPIDWIGKYGKVALTGKPLQFESYAEPLKKWYSISAFCPHKGYFAVTFSDISERKLAENSIRRAKEEWERTFNSVPDMIAIIDKKHRVVRVNESMAKRLGRTAEECVGMPCYKAVHGTNVPPAFCPHSRTIKDCCDHVQDIHEERLGMDLLVTTTPLFDEQGKLIGSVHVARDITERKKAEEQLRQRSEELAEANKELDAFSYAVSNDLRAPLRTIEGFTAAIIEDCASKLDNTARDYFNRVISASRRMSQLIDAMLNMARLTRGELLERTVNLSDLAEVAAYELGKKYPERRVKSVIAKGVKAQGDIDMLRVVIENLMDNAWKFTGGHDQAKIEFGVMQEKIGHIGPIYFVRDDGAGFNMDYADKLFTPFNRLHSESEFPGLGIGLATVHKIISKHGGKIWAESAQEKGAAFYFTLG